MIGELSGVTGCDLVEMLGFVNGGSMDKRDKDLPKEEVIVCLAIGLAIGVVSGVLFNIIYG